MCPCSHRVVPMPADWIASRDSPDRHDATAYNSIFRNRIARVYRATRFEAAGRSVHRMDYRRDSGTINRDRAESHESRRCFHSIDWIGKLHHLRSAVLLVIRPLSLRAAAISSSAIESVARLPAPARAITTIEVPGASAARIWPRKISRTRRFTRFRITALPIRRETVTPRRERSGSVSRIPA